MTADREPHLQLCSLEVIGQLNLPRALSRQTKISGVIFGTVRGLKPIPGHGSLKAKGTEQ